MRCILKTFPAVLSFLKRAMASGNPFNFEQRLRRFDDNIGGLTTAASQFAMTLGVSHAGTFY
jgi:hypothetical protein